MKKLNLILILILAQMQIRNLQGDIIDLDWDFHPRQSRALDLLDEQELEELTYGGAKGGGKTVLGCRWIYLECEKLIAEFGLEPSDNPIAVGVIGRKRGTDFYQTTLETWKREIPASVYRINEQKKEIIIRETVKLFYVHFDDRQDIQRFNSMELCRYFVDQVEELTEEEIAMLRVTMRLKINGKCPAYKGLLTCNPKNCWLKGAIVKNPNLRAEKRAFLQALPADNPYLAPDYVERLERSFKFRPELLNAYRYGNWDQLEGSDIVIKDAWVSLSHNKPDTIPSKKRLLAVDVARFGDDRTVIFYMKGTNIIEAIIYGQKDTYYTTNQIAVMANKYKNMEGLAPLIVIDGDGVGGPVADNLRAMGFKVLEIHSAGKSSDPEKYVNLRSQMWWEAGEMYGRGDIVNTYENSELDIELTIPKYDFRAGKILIESKEDIKKPERYGKSPDLADTYIYGLYGLKFAAERIIKEEPRRHKTKVSPMGIG